MTRKKVKLAWIANDSARRASLKKRRLGLLKKVSELTTLCGVNACVIVYSPDEMEPVVWPSHTVVHELLARFRSMPELDQLKKMMNQETYLRERVTKVQEQLAKWQRRNKEVEMAHLMHQISQGKGLDELNLGELHGLTWLVEEKMKEIKKRIEFYQQVPFASGGSNHRNLPSSPQGPSADETAQLGSVSAGLGGDGRNPTESFLWDQWFIDMMNNNEHKSASNSSIRSDMGLPYHPFAASAADDHLALSRHSFGGSSSIAADMGLPPHGNFRGPPTDMGLLPISFRPHGGASEMGMPHGSSFGGNSFGPFGSDMGLGLHPFGGHIGSNSAGSELGPPPFGLFGGNSGGAGGDMGLPFDGKTWPNNFSS